MVITKMNNLYVLRHCKTVNNIQNIITGQMDVPIMEGEQIEMNQYNHQGNLEILCSPLIRCKETVSIFLNNINFVPQVTYCNDLLERNMGELEGMERSKAIAKYPEYFIDNKFIYNKTPPHGESYTQLCERVDRFINTLLIKKIMSQNVILCSHNHVLKIIYLKLMNISSENNWFKIRFENGKIYNVFLE